MKTIMLCFSPTGGTQKVAKIIEKVLPVDTWIDLCDAQKQEELYLGVEDTCILAVPSYGGRAPKIVLDRLHHIHGNQTNAILICTYGNRAFDDTLLEMKTEMQKQGFMPVAAVAAVSEHSILHEYGAGRPDAQDEAELFNYAKKIIEVLAQAKKKVVEVPGNSVYRKYSGVPLKPNVNASCTKCGVCATLCPVQAISVQDPSLTQKDICISCMRCIAVCPNHARSISSALKLAAKLKIASECKTRKESQLFVSSNKD